MKCYFILEKENELEAGYEYYANSTSDFYKVAKAADYSCLSYVLRIWNRWIGLERDVAAAKRQLTNHQTEQYDCYEIPLCTDHCIVMYEYYGADYASHVVLVEGGTVKAKLNRQERVRHSNIDCYFVFTDNTAQGSLGLPYYFFNDAFATN